MKTKRKAKIIAILILTASLLVGFLAGYLINLGKPVTDAAEKKAEKGELPADLLSTAGFENVENIDLEPPTLMLSTNCSRLDMNITDDQIYSIGYALNNISTPRPLTHDIFKSLIDNYNIEILQIKIDSVNDEGIYKAKIIFRQENKVLILDSRPSDATGLAVRTNQTIWIKKDILDKYSINIC